MDILDIQAALVGLGLGTQFSAEPGTLRNDYDGQSFDRYVSEWAIVEMPGCIPWRSE